MLNHQEGTMSVYAQLTNVRAARASERREIQTKYHPKCYSTSSLLRFIRLHFGLKNSPEKSKNNSIISPVVNITHVLCHPLSACGSSRIFMAHPIGIGTNISHDEPTRKRTQTKLFLSIKIFLRFTFTCCLLW